MKKLMACLVAACAFTAVAEKGDEYVTDKGGGVYEINATTGLTLDDFSEGWSNRFYNSTDTFVFKGAGEKGMCFDNRTLFETKPYTNQFSHLVFDGGVQTYGWYPSNQIDAATLRLAAGSTRENPAIKVKSGTTLNFFNRTFRSGTGRYGADLGAWFEVEDGATLILTNDSPRAYYGETSYLLFPTILHPGATYALSLVDVAMPPLDTSGCRSTFTQSTLFYVPATTPGDTRIARVDVRLSWVYVNMPANETTPGFGMDVGENATLEFTGRIGGDQNNKYFPICKYGAGTLNWKGKPESANRHFNVFVKSGTFIYDPGVYITSESLLKPEVSSGATLVLPSANALVQRDKVTGLLNDGTVRVTGTGATTLWDCRKVGVIETPDGATINFARTVDPRECRAPLCGENVSRLTVYDGAKTVYPIVGSDADYVYWNYVETISDDTTLVGVHSLRVVNPTPGTPRSVKATAADYAIGPRSVTVDVAANTTFTLDAPVNGTLQKLSGDGDFIVRASGRLTVLTATGFTGHLTVKGGVAVLPKSLEGRVTAEDGALVVYQSLADFATQSVTFTVAGYRGASTLENFPVLVRLSETTVPGVSQIAADAHIIAAATDSDETYPCDVETWDPSGESLVWVRVPELKPTGTSFRLLFGTKFPACTSADTWRRTDAEPGDGTTDTGNFAAVWHMATASRADVPDATGNGLTAVPYANTTTRGYIYSEAVSGPVGTARQVSAEKKQNGPKLIVSGASYNARQLGTVFTASCWARLKDLPDDESSFISYPRMFSIKKSYSNAIGWEIESGNNDSASTRGTFNVRGAGAQSLKYQLPSAVWSQHDDRWDYFSFVYDDRKIRFYVNGSLMSETTVSAPITNLCSDMDFYIGGAYSEWSFAGEMDEARLFDGAQSADWVAADYATQADVNFLSAGPLTPAVRASHSVAFEVTGYQGATTLENYPVLVRLSEATVPGVSQFGAKTGVWAASADGETFYPCDVETWNPSGESLVWVRLPEISQSGAVFKLLFAEGCVPGSAAATWRRTDNAPGTAGGTGNFAGVWHMASPSQSDVPDATGNGLTAVPYSGKTTLAVVDRTESIAASGAIGSGRQITASAVAEGGPRLQVSSLDYAKMKVATNFTVSAWIRFDDGNRYPRLFAHENRTNGSRTGWHIEGYLDADWHQKVAKADKSTYEDATWTDTWQVGQWRHYVFVYDGFEARAYLDGTPFGLAKTFNQTAAVLDPKQVFCIGGSDQDWNVKGAMDEVRLFSGALSADWVKADYDSQRPDATFLTAGSLMEEEEVPSKSSLDASIIAVTSEGIDATATVTGPDGSEHAITAKLLDADGEELASQTVAVTCPAEAVKFTFADLAPQSDYHVVVSATGTEATDLYLFGVTTVARYVLLAGDANTNASFGSTDANAETWTNHKNNWSNTVDGTILAYPSATSDFDFVVDATQGPDPTAAAPNRWMLRTRSANASESVTFPGRRLTIVGKRGADLNYGAGEGGGLGLKSQSTGADQYFVTIRELVLKNGTIWSEVGDFNYLRSRIVIPKGYSGFFETAYNQTSERWLSLYGSIEGEGTAVFCQYSRDTNSRGFHFHNDLSSFAGKFHFDKCRDVRFFADCVPFADRAELTPDGLTLDCRCVHETGTYRADDRGINRIFFEDTTTWATPNLGITFADSGAKLNAWDFAIANGVTVTIACPLYGAATDKGAAKTRLGLNGEDANYRTGTLRLCGAQGDWAGTFVAANGTLVLAGAKPLGEGTLDVSGTGKVELDLAALAGGACYVKAATDGTRINVTLPDGLDPETDLALISTPADGGVKKDQLVINGGLPEKLALRSTVRDGVRTFAVGRKRGFVLIFR